VAGVLAGTAGLSLVSDTLQGLDMTYPVGSVNSNPQGMGLIRLIAEDLRTQEGVTAGFLVLLLHRLGNKRMDLPQPYRVVATAAYRLAHGLVAGGTGIRLDYTVTVGRRVRIWHHGGMWLNAIEIGDDSCVRHNVTLGVRRTTEPGSKPRIGRGVDVGVGAVLLGAVRVGDGARIGANAVVLQDVPPGALAVGVPARVTVGGRPVVEEFSGDHPAIRKEGPLA
jgi:serine O-acetyltransferase